MCATGRAHLTFLYLIFLTALRGSRGSSVSIETSLRAGRPGFNSRQEQ